MYEVPMYGKFGIKDLVLLALIIAVGALTIGNMIQKDRVWDELQTVRTLVAEQKQMMSQLRERIESGGIASPAPTRAGQSAGARDESWARPGVPVTWPKPYAYTSLRGAPSPRSSRPSRQSSRPLSSPTSMPAGSSRTLSARCSPSTTR
jgi:hypothetical protein